MDIFESNLTAESLPLELSNGLVLVKTCPSPSPIELSIYLDCYSKLALVSCNSVFLFNGIDFTRDYDITPDQFKRITFLKTLRQYICLLGTDVLSVRSINMIELSSYKSSTEISCLVSNEVIPEIPSIVTSGPGNITIWTFRVGARKIIPRVAHTHLFSFDESPQLLCLDSHHGKQQKCYIAISDSLVVILLEAGTLIIRISNIHSFPISCLLPLLQFSVLITGSTVGVIKVWGNQYNLLHSFVGHEDMITDMLLIPKSTLILTSSRDSSLRLWNLETGDLRHSLILPSPAHKVYLFNSFVMLAQSESSIFEVKITEIFKFYRSFPSHVANMSYCSGSNIVIVTNSSMLAVMDTRHCEIVNALWIDRNLGSIKQVLFLEKYCRLFVLTGFGNIIIGKTDTFPVDIVEIWKGNYSCFTLYNMILEDGLDQNTTDKWFNYDIYSNEIDQSFIQHTYMLIVGLSTGMLTKLNLLNGIEDFTTMAHDSEIFRIISQTRNEQILTCSFEGTIKIWRVYPHIHECLLQVNAFKLISVPSIIIASKKRICFAINCADQALNTIEMYDPQTLNQFTHTYNEDHQDTIVDLAVCSSIGIFVSIGIDETVRFWDEDNTLLSILWIFCSPNCICFSNERADILIALDQQVFSIDAKTYIPNFFASKLLGITMMDSHKGVVTLFCGPLDRMTSIGLKELKVIDNRKQQQNFQMNLKSNEIQISQNIRKDEKYCFHQSSETHGDLKMLIDCTKWVQKRRNIEVIPSGNMVKSWNEYYGKCCSPPYKMNIKLDDKLVGKNQLDQESYNGEYIKSSSNNFFQPRDDFAFKYGFIPNSIYLQQFIQAKSRANESSIFDINLLLLKDPSALNLSLDNELEKPFLEDSLFSKFEEKLRNHSRDILEQSEDIDRELSPTQTTLSTSNRNDDLFCKDASLNLINKKIAKYSKTSAKPILLNYRDELDSPIPKNLISPSIPFIPKIIQQFLFERWFEVLFPNLNSETFPNDCSHSSCFSIIFSACSKNRDNSIKIEALQSIILLDKQSSFSEADKESILGIIISKLLCPVNPINFPTNKEFIFGCLSVLDKFCSPNDLKYISYLLVEFILGDLETRHVILDYLKYYGLSDPFKYLSRELDSWNIENVTTSFEKIKLLKYTMDWLQELIFNMLNSTNGHTQSSSTLKAKKCPCCIEALNQLVKRRTQMELQTSIIVAKPLSPSTSVPLKVEPQLKSVVTLPKICLKQKIIRMGETHNSECHDERETTLDNYAKSPFIGMMKYNSSKNISLHIPVHHQNLTLSQSKQGRVIFERLQEKRKYFLLTQSQLI